MKVKLCLLSVKFALSVNLFEAILASHRFLGFKDGIKFSQAFRPSSIMNEVVASPREQYQMNTEYLMPSG